MCASTHSATWQKIPQTLLTCDRRAIVSMHPDGFSQSGCPDQKLDQECAAIFRCTTDIYSIFYWIFMQRRNFFLGTAALTATIMGGVNNSFAQTADACLTPAPIPQAASTQWPKSRHCAFPPVLTQVLTKLPPTDYPTGISPISD